jgi:hypothetical protein
MIICEIEWQYRCSNNLKIKGAEKDEKNTCVSGDSLGGELNSLSLPR